LSISKRLRRAAVGVAAIAVLGTVASSTAFAGGIVDGSANDPNTTNVPYLAWRGENLRLVKCFGVNDFNDAYQSEFKQSANFTNDSIQNIFGSIVQTNVQLEDWSGVDTGVNTPHEVINGARTFLYYNVRTFDPVICFQDTWASQKAGLGQFKLTVSVGLTNIENTGVSLGAQMLVMQHQWLAAWMNLNAPALDEVTSRDANPPNPAGHNTNPEGLGDPKGDGSLFAGDHWVQGSDGKWYWDPNNTHPAQLRAVVTGTIPLDQNYATELGLGTSLTLPNDWAALATKLATDGSAFNSNQPMRWDIHDEMVDENGNTLTTTGGRSLNATDKVTNVANPSPTLDGFSSFTRGGVITSQTPNPLDLQPTDYGTTGPFDPNFAEETLLPDGQLNAGDAPMPAARIDFAIAPNTDPLTSTDGVGSFESASKAKTYSMDDTGSDAVAKNLFAPFYGQYIPATSRDPFGYASGVDGALITNNFPGFLTFGFVDNWESFGLNYVEATKTNCNRTIGNLRSTPSGYQTSAVYTDEHGEARINFLPGGADGNGFYFDALNTIPNDSNQGCDLIGHDVLGTAHITAIARYPYQRPVDPDKPAKTSLVKTVHSLFDKHLSYYPKNYNYTSANAELAKVIVAHGQDIQGKPFAGEVVCFSGSYVNQDESPAGGTFNGFVPNNSNFVVNRPDGTSFSVNNQEAPNPLGDGYKCAYLDANGNAVFEETGSAKGFINIVANYVDEGLLRTILVDTRTGATSADNPPLTPELVLAGHSATTGPGTNGNSAPSPATVDQIVKAAIAGGFGIVATPAVTVTPTQTITPTKTITVVKAAVKARLLSLRLVRPAHAKAYIMVKVLSPHKTAKITIALKGKNGKTISKFTKTIQANKQVKIHSSLIKLAVKRISLILVK
jgi:hypothetical protein